MPDIATHQQIADFERTASWDGGETKWGHADITVNLAGLDAVAAEAARLAFRLYADITPLTFIETSGPADITVASDPTLTAAGVTTSQAIAGALTSSSVSINPDVTFDTAGGLFYPDSLRVIVHEIGHALGLGHTGLYGDPGDPSAAYGVDNAFTNDSWQVSVMSYFDQVTNWTVDADLAPPVTPQVADLIALQDMYGQGSARSGNTTYGYNASPGLPEIYDATLYGRPAGPSYTIWDTGGVDTLDLSGAAAAPPEAPLHIDLRATGRNTSVVYASDLGADLRGSIVIAPGVVLERAVGSPGADIVTGNAADNVLWGNAGDDWLSGAAGRDTLIGGGGNDSLAGGPGADSLIGEAGRDIALYAGAGPGLAVDLQAPAANAGEAAGDSYSGVEDVQGSDNGDSLSGNGLANRLWGADGDDLLSGRGGNDTLLGGAGHDALLGGPGADALIGGAGRDRAIYAGAAAGVRADLQSPGGNAGEAAGDSYSGVEDLQGSGHGDDLLGDDLANRIWGGAGDDRLYGRGGADVLSGGPGNDHLIGGPGDDGLDGGAGADALIGEAGRDRAVYAGAATGVHADLQAPAANTGEAAGDSYSGVEDMLGSGHADDLLGDGLANRLWGGAGNDLLHGRGGDDTLSGGAGADLLIGGPGEDRLSGEAGADAFLFRPDYGLDRVTDFQTGLDTLVLGSGLWGGAGLTGQQVVDGFATLKGTHAVFDFGDGDTLALLDVNTLALADDIAII